MKKAWLCAAVFVFSTTLFAHGGGLDANGGHYNNKTGKYHCHKAKGKNGKPCVIKPDRPPKPIENPCPIPGASMP